MIYRASDFFWGDRSTVTSALTTLIKFSMMVFLTWLFHQYILIRLVQVYPDDVNALNSSLQATNAILKRAPLHESLKGKSLEVCLDVLPINSGAFCEHSQFASDGSTREALGYQILIKDPRAQEIKSSSDFVRVSGDDLFGTTIFRFVSKAHIDGSVDTFLRDVERIAFNDQNAAVTDIALCSGTRKLLTGAACRSTTEIYDLLVKGSSGSPSLESIINRIRVGSLFIGAIQFGTLSIFLYAMLEMFGLWLRWISPSDKLYKVQVTDGIASLVVPDNKAFENSEKSPVRSVGDRLFARGMAAGMDPAGANVQTSDEAVVATLASYREFLIDDATSRQENLETLGDAMLKLAFMGTVYGISTALFAARGLDTADPIRKLLSKAEMYSGIGVGFGATLVGIILSIIASQLRTTLSALWVSKIGTAYRLTLDYGAPALKRDANRVPLPLRPKPGQIRRFVPPKRQRTAMEVLGIIVLVIFIIWIWDYSVSNLN